MGRSSRKRAVKVIGTAALVAPAWVARAQSGGFEPAPAMPFWAMALLIVLIGAVGFLMTRKK
jgi:hypothetical protein